MGTLMAGRLIAAGNDVTVWNRTADKAAELVAAGAKSADTPALAVADADIVITMLTGPEAVTEVLSDASSGLRDGAIVVDMSTVGPKAIADLRSLLPQGVRFIDAPVKGSLPAASSGELGIYVGGSDEDFAAAKDVLSVLGKPKHVGPLGTGAGVKLIVNIVIGSTFVMVGEALQLAESLGLDTELALTALEGTAISPMMPRVRAKLDSPEPTQFALGLAEKDLRLVLAAGVADNGVVAGAQQQLADAVADGLSDKDISAILGRLRASDHDAS